MNGEGGNSMDLTAPHGHWQQIPTERFGRTISKKERDVNKKNKQDFSFGPQPW
jgi:hypothetical protein